MAIAEESVYDREKAKFDTNNRVMVLDRPEAFQNIVDGNSYLFSDVGSLASLAKAEYSFSTGAGVTTISLNLMMASDIGPCLIQMWENPTITALGTVLPSMNLNRTSLNTEQAVITLTPSISAYPARASWARIVPGGKDGNAGGGQMALVMKPNTNYVFSVINNGNQAANYSFELMFMEQ